MLLFWSFIENTYLPVSCNWIVEKTISTVSSFCGIDKDSHEGVMETLSPWELMSTTLASISCLSGKMSMTLDTSSKKSLASKRTAARLSTIGQPPNKTA